MLTFMSTLNTPPLGSASPTLRTRIMPIPRLVTSSLPSVLSRSLACSREIWTEVTPRCFPGRAPQSRPMTTSPFHGATCSGCSPTVRGSKRMAAFPPTDGVLDRRGLSL